MLEAWAAALSFWGALLFFREVFAGDSAPYVYR